MLQKQFIENAAHDLRTPLSVIRMNAEMALLSLHEGSELRSTFLGIIEEVDRMSKMLSELVSQAAFSDTQRDQV
ncbi:hypothetical protein HZC00_02640 [Candidatus Kaiserbacteria bacterium]|nr:hypothetical protein [Candidatus Kaiserbacteria bacterium]